MTDAQLESALQVALDEILDEFPGMAWVPVLLIDENLPSRSSDRRTVAVYENPHGHPRIVVSLPGLRYAVERPGMNLLECCRKLLRHEFGHAAGLTHAHPKMPNLLTA